MEMGTPRVAADTSLGRTALPPPTRYFAGSDRRARAHVRTRWAMAPLRSVTAALPEEGEILDWGCGHGLVALLAADEAPGRSVVGADIDTDKLATARQAAATAGFGDRVTFWDLDDGALPSGTWDAVAIVDMLYLLAPAAQEALVREAAACLAPGGVLVVKDLDDRPRVKAWLASVQEAISVRVTRITATADGLHRPPGPAQVERWMEAAGLTTERQPCHRGRHAPHVLVVGRRAADGGFDLPRRRADAMALVHLCVAALSESGGTFPF